MPTGLSVRSVRGWGVLWLRRCCWAEHDVRIGWPAPSMAVWKHVSVQLPLVRRREPPSSRMLTRA